MESQPNIIIRVTYSQDLNYKDLEDETYKSQRLKPAKNIRVVYPHCCGACKHGIVTNGMFLCKRSGGYETDAGNGYQWFRVCDGFAPRNDKEEG